MKPRRKRGWIYTSNIYAYLLSKALLAFLLLLAAQTFFYLSNTRIFHVADAKEWLGIVWGNIIFGIATIGCLLLPYFVANLLPFKFRWNKHYHRLTEILLYYVPVLFIIISDICDASYYQYTYRRLTGEIFQYLGISGNMGSLWPHFLVDYWHSTLFGFILIFATFFLGTKIKLIGRNKYRNHRANDIVGLIVGVAVVIFLLRGGFGKNIDWHDTTNYCQAKNSALVTNSGYNIVRTFNGGTLQEVDYLDDAQALQLFNPAYAPYDFTADSTPWTPCWAPNAGHFLAATPDSLKHQYNNIVVIVLESFSQEYMGCYNHGIMPSFTPFLDSLAQHSIVYQGRANGKKSIEGIPAIFSSLPTLMPFPITMSDYADDSLRALPGILRDNGFHTAFFHGSYNGVMSFDKLCARMGFQEYYGQNEYMADRLSKESDYDGVWGIFDEHFLQYMVRRLSTFPQPFFSGVFTISSHHPYTMQPERKGQFPEGPHPLCQVVAYSDNALRLFFEAAKQTDWYEHTVFLITADHSGQGLSREYNDYNGWYRIPMIIHLPESATDNTDNNPPHHVYSRLMQQTDIMPTLLDYLGIRANTVCFGTSVFRNPEGGWQIAYGNSYYQLETPDGVAVLCQDKEEGNGNIKLLKAIVQQYNHHLINNQLR
ncbi:MAG: LTA synthase family protein [Bacteroidales bacterium]|nr:LTA synthase family protein [Bacteroidales bacterium]